MLRKRENPAMVRSRIALIDALIDLMKEKSFKKISIQEITDRAGLSRQTFYTNFETKEDIIKHSFNKLFEMLDSQYKDDEYFFSMYFRFWKEHDILLKQVFYQFLDFIFLENNMIYFQEHGDHIKQTLDIAEEDLPYMIGYLSNLTYIMLKVWMIEDESKSIEEIYDITVSFARGNYFKNFKEKLKDDI